MTAAGPRRFSQCPSSTQSAVPHPNSLASYTGSSCDTSHLHTYKIQSKGINLLILGAPQQNFPTSNPHTCHPAWPPPRPLFLLHPRPSALSPSLLTRKAASLVSPREKMYSLITPNNLVQAGRRRATAAASAALSPKVRVTFPCSMPTTRIRPRPRRVRRHLQSPSLPSSITPASDAS